MRKNDTKILVNVSFILFGIYVFSKLHDAIGTGGIAAIIVAVIGYFIYSLSKNKKITVTRESHVENRENKDINFKDYGNFIRHLTSIYLKNIGLYLYLYVDIEKNTNVFTVKVHDLGAHEKNWEPHISEKIGEYKYNVLTRRWKNGLHPFEYKSPSKFINFLIDAWRNTNGDLPRIESKNLPTEVKASSTVFSLPRYNDDLLVKYDEDVPVKGSGSSEYTVNIAQLSCTCPDFKKRRSGFVNGDIRRICKHLAKEIIRRGVNTKLTHDKKLQAIVRKASSTSRGVFLYKKIILVKIEEDIKGQGEFYIVIPLKDNGWIEIIWFTAKTYMNHGYNVIERRWAYGNNPFPDGSKAKYNIAIQQAYKKHQ